MKDLGAELAGLVKINNKGFCKETIGSLINDCPGGSYLVFKINPTVTRDTPLGSIVYRYNSHKFLYSITT